MTELPAWLQGTRWIDAVIALTLLEGVALVAWHRASGGRRGLGLRDALGFLGAGLALMLALRVAVAGGPAWTAAAWVAVAGLAHCADLGRRTRRPG